MDIVRCLDCGKQISLIQVIRGRCPECARRRKAESNRAYYRRMRSLGDSIRLAPGRVCHDCGRPTTDYRCRSCWAKIRSDSTKAVEDFGDSAYIVY